MRDERIVHELKCQTEFFKRSWVGSKTFEVRFNNRDFQAGDWVRLIETDGRNGIRSGRTIEARIKYVMSLNALGALGDGTFKDYWEWVVLGLGDMLFLSPKEDGDAVPQD